MISRRSQTVHENGKEPGVSKGNFHFAILQITMIRADYF